MKLKYSNWHLMGLKVLLNIVIVASLDASSC